MVTFGAFIRQTRLDRDLKQHEVGQAVGRGQRAAAAWEAGAKFPKEKLPELADVLCIPVEVLLHEWEDTFEPGMNSRMISLGPGSGKTEAIAQVMLHVVDAFQRLSTTLDELTTVTQRAAEVLDRLEQSAPKPSPSARRAAEPDRGKSRSGK